MTNASVPAERLEALRKEAWKMCETGGSTLVPDAQVLVNRLYAFAQYVIEQCDALLSEAREEVKPSLQDMRRFAPAMTEAVYDALVRDAMNWRTQQKALSASAGTEGPGLPVGYMWKSSPGKAWEDTHFSVTLPEFSTATWFLGAVSNGYCTAVVPIYARVEGEKK